MSSWLAFHVMGFYRNAGQSYYLINTTFFKKRIIHHEKGKIFVIKAPPLSDKNKYIVAALLNGVRYEKSCIEHNDIVNVEELILEMGAFPFVNWGTKIVPPPKRMQVNNQIKLVLKALYYQILKLNTQLQ